MPLLSELLEDAAHGDERALDQLVAAVEPMVVRYCRARLGSEEDGPPADEVARKVCLAVRRVVSSRRIAEPRLPVLVYAIAARVVSESGREAGDRTAPATTAERLSRLLDTVTTSEREVLVLRLQVGLNSDQAAEILGITPGQVRIIQHRVLDRLRHALSEQADHC